MICSQGVLHGLIFGDVVCNEYKLLQCECLSLVARKSVLAYILEAINTTNYNAPIFSWRIKAWAHDAALHATLRAIVSISCGHPLQNCRQHRSSGVKKKFFFLSYAFIFVHNLKHQLAHRIGQVF